MIVPGLQDSKVPVNPQAWDRYSYCYNDPVTLNDPDGHDPTPYDQFIPQAIDFFVAKGYEVVGNAVDAAAKNIYTNGADLVFRSKETVLAVELKMTNNVNLGTLGKNLAGNYGGSIDRVLQGADKFAGSTINQLKAESKAIQDAYESGNLQNALYTTAQNVSDKARDQFNSVYSNVAKVGAPAAAAAKGELQLAGGFLSSCETTLTGIFFYKPFDPYNSQVQ
jgi:hypothetical protein